MSEHFVDLALESFHPYKTGISGFKNLGFVPGLNNCTALATQLLNANTMNLIPFFVKNAFYVQTAYVNVTSGGVSSTIRLAIYSNSGNVIAYPFKAVFSSALLAGSSVAVVSANVATLLSDNSLYWIAMNCGTANTQVRSIAIAGMNPFLGLDTAMGTAPVWGIATGFTATASLPPFFSIGGVTATGAGIPAILLVGS